MSAKIISVKIGAMPMHLFDSMPTIRAFFDNGENEVLFSFYPDEISFNEKEFVGLTKEEAIALRTKKDIAYLKS